MILNNSCIFQNKLVNTMLESILPLQPATAVAVDKYCHTHSTPLPPLFADHQAWTVEKFDKWLMLSGPVQAQLFSFLVSDRGATRVLELGTFFGVERRNERCERGSLDV
jgi:predicted O-methyltransferase YrrM